MRKDRYDGSLRKADTRTVYAKAVQGTADGEEYFEQLIFGSVKQLIMISFENQNVGSDW